MLDNEKKQVLENALLAEKENLCYTTSGNFSMINRDSNLVAITPTGKDRTQLSYSDILVIDLDGNILEGPQGFVPSSEKNIHLSIYKARKDIIAVAHTHSPYACVFAALGKEIKPVLFEANRFDFRCPISPYRQPGSQELADSIVETLGEHGVATIMETHGALTASRKSMKDALIKAIYLEDVARTYYRMGCLVGLDNVETMSLEEYDRMMIACGKKEY